MLLSLCLEPTTIHDEIESYPVFDSIELDDINFDITYQLLLNIFDEDLAPNIQNTKVLRLKKLNRYLNEFNNTFSITLLTRSQLVKELYFLYQTARALDRYNQEKLKLSYRIFRSKVYFPNIMYLLIRLLPEVRKFFQSSIRKVYQEFYSRSNGLINVHINSFYIDQDVIKSDILYEFIGNGIKKQNPLDLNNIKLFYNNCFRSIFQFYLKRKKDLSDQDVVSMYYFEDDYKNSGSSNRAAIYRDVLYRLHIKKSHQKLPLLCHLSYNFQIFKNIIITNEFQNLYQSAKNSGSLTNNNEFRLLDFYDDDVFEKFPDLFASLKKLPMIYKLLRCVHILSNGKAYNDLIIKPDVIKDVVYEELFHPFKNMFLDEYIYEILKRISSNFVNNILTGEYINLMTFSTVKINHLSFIDQIRKFVRLCLLS